MSEQQGVAGPDQRHDRVFESMADFYASSAYSAFPQKHHGGGSFGVYFLEAEQTAIDLVDPPVPEFIFAHLTHGSPEVIINAGDGRSRAINTLGGLALSPPNTEVRFTISEPHVARCLAVPEANVCELLTLSELSADCFNPITARHVHRPDTAPIMEKMWRLVQARDPTLGLLFDGLFLQYLATLAGAMELTPLGHGHPEDDRMARVIEYVEAHVGEALTVTELAAVACLSPGHFSRTFKATTGEAVWSYVQRRRCERARDMLIGTREPIAQIAFTCGFSNQAHMTRQLSARFGATPGAIRKDAAP